MVLVIVVAMNHEPKHVNVAQLKTECGVMISLGGWLLCPARAASTCAITHGWGTRWAPIAAKTAKGEEKPINHYHSTIRR